MSVPVIKHDAVVAREIERHLFQQNQNEFDWLLTKVKGKSLLEVGSCFGGTIAPLAKKMNAEVVVSVDLGYGVGLPMGVNTIGHLQAALDTLEGEKHLIIGDSHSVPIIERARRLGPYDVVFIDGDHSHKGVLMDWLAYGQMGKMIAFHDVKECPGVVALWKDLKRHYHTEELMIQHGIGILYRAG